MGEQTKIAWTEHTFSPWLGCSKVSPACLHCYAERWAQRSGLVTWGGPRRLTADATWRKVLRWYEDAKRRGVIERVFPSLCDPLDAEVPEEWRERFWGLIRGTHEHLRWMLLTKRPQNICVLLPKDVAAVCDVGVTVEDQERARERLPLLCATEARSLFVSCEPLLGPVEIPHRFLLDYCIDLVIVGGESGPNARSMDIDWVRWIRDDCAATGVAFMYKQGWGLHPEKLPLLDGRRWDGFPANVHPLYPGDAP